MKNLFFAAFLAVVMVSCHGESLYDNSFMIDNHSTHDVLVGVNGKPEKYTINVGASGQFRFMAFGGQYDTLYIYDRATSETLYTFYGKDGCIEGKRDKNCNSDVTVHVGIDAANLELTLTDELFSAWRENNKSEQ